MSLLEDINARIAEDENYLDLFDVEDAEELYNDIIDTTRWSNVMEAVYKRGDEYVMVTWLDPATEMQEGEPHEAEAWAVVPKEVITTEYVKVDTV